MMDHLHLQRCVITERLDTQDILDLCTASQDVANTLKDAGAKGTFFFNGNNCEPVDFLPFSRDSHIVHLRWLYIYP